MAAAPEPKHARNAEIARRVRDGEKQSSVASDHGLTQQRVSKIVKAQEKKRSAGNAE